MIARPNYSPGDYVTDTERDDEQDTSPEDGIAVVIEATGQQADEVAIPALGGKTVADVNPRHPSDSEVIRIAFLTTLKQSAPGWDEQPQDKLADWLAEYKREWGVTVRVYSYPASRLAHVDYDPEGEQ